MSNYIARLPSLNDLNLSFIINKLIIITNSPLVQAKIKLYVFMI